MQTDDLDAGPYSPRMRNTAPVLIVQVPKLSRRRRLAVYAIVAGVWFTGAAWVLFHYFLMRAGPFGATPHPLERWWLASHGAFGFASLWLLGLLWGVHIPIGWRSYRRRWSGSAMFALALWLIVSGYALYYLGTSDDSISTVAFLHWSIGLISPALFILHRFAKERRLPL